MPFKNSKLKQRSRGKKVGQLQKLLIAYGHLTKLSDIKNQYFGKATEEALEQLQKQFKLPASGTVDTRTANRLTSIYDNIFDKEGRMNLFSVKGRVLDQREQGVNKAKVELWALKRGNEVQDLKKADTTNKKGEFSFTVSARDLIDVLTGGIPKLFFRIYYQEQLIEDTRNSVIWNPTIQQPELQIKVRLEPIIEKKWAIQGSISKQDGKPYESITVIARDKKNDLFLAETKSDNQGFFTIAFEDQQLPNWLPADYLPTVYFNLSEGTTFLKSTSDTPLKNLKADTHAITLVVETPAPKEEFTLNGTILSNKRVGLGGLLVKAYHKSISGNQLLGETASAPDGSYKILFTADSADVEVQVFEEERPDEVLAISPIRYNAKQDERINVVVAENKIKSTNEYSQITAELRKELGGKNFRDLQENEQQQDITYLANKTGWDARMVAMVALADEYSAKTNVPAPYYYAMFRAGMPTTAEGVNQVNVATAEKVWLKAAEQNIIDDGLKAGIADNLQQFNQEKTQFLLNQAAPVGVSNLDNMLSVSLAGRPTIAADKQKFASIYFNHQGSTEELWVKVEQAMPGASAALQLDGKLGFLTLNNAPLVKALKETGNLDAQVQNLVPQGLYKKEAWENNLLDNSIPIPDDFPGDNPAGKRSNYAAYMANQIKISYPTAVLSEQVRLGEMKLAEDGLKDEVRSFLWNNQEKFNIGEKPVRQFVKEAAINPNDKVVKEVERLQRTYQVSPSDETMATLLTENLDSAYKIVQYGAQEFKDRFSAKLGGERLAELIYNKAHQVHSTVTTVAVGYLTHQTNPDIFALSGGKTRDDIATSDLIAYPTLEELFGEMDFCECKHCRSVLSPAAYLVDLLKFIDKEPAAADVADKKENPLEVLLQRRPDIQHIQLSCENTNTVLPYIDLVNEILEHFTVHAANAADTSANDFHPLEGFVGFDVTEDLTTQDLLANPQFVKKEAYEILKNQVYPFSLPFNQSLTALRNYYEHLEVPLYQAMEILRKGDTYELTGAANEPPYAWFDIYLEYLGIPREAANILWNDNGGDPAIFFGATAGEDLNTVFGADNTYAKKFTRRVGINYKELTALVKTQFINPAAYLIPKLEKLYVNLNDIIAFVDDNISEADFDELLPESFTEEEKTAAKTWLKDNTEAIKSLILLVDETGGGDECSFEQLILKYAEGSSITNLDYFKLLRFIRLWKMMGWSLEETDKVLTALYELGDDGNELEKLNTGFKNLIPRLFTLKKVMELLRLKPKRDLLKALALWIDIDTQGKQSFYKKLFLNPSILKIDAVFQPNDKNEFLSGDNIKIVPNHEAAILAAFNLNSEELGLILDQIVLLTPTYNNREDVPLIVSVVSQIYRYAFLSKALKMSIQELITLMELTQINPYDKPANIHPDIIRFIEIAQQLKKAKIKIPNLDYYLRHRDPSGEASPNQSEILQVAKVLKDELQRIDKEFSTEMDATGEAAQSLMATLYGSDVTNQFFGYINATTASQVAYDHHQSELENELTAVVLDGVVIGQQLIYNDFRKTLAFRGLLTPEMKDAFDTAADIIADNADKNSFIAAIQRIFEESEKQRDELEELFAKHPALKTPFENYLSNFDLDALIAEILATFKTEQKAQSITQKLADLLGVELAMIEALLENEKVLHAAEDTTQNALTDFLKLTQNGIVATVVFPDDTTSSLEYTNIDFGENGIALPNLAAGEKFKSVTIGFLVEVAENDFFNFYIETETGATVELSINQETIAGILNGTTWENTVAIALNGNSLYAVEIVMENVEKAVQLKWQTESNAGTPQLFDPAQLYIGTSFYAFNKSYLRLLKAIALIETLDLSPVETAIWGAKLLVDGEGFLNRVPIAKNVSDVNTPKTLLEVLLNLLDYHFIKEAEKVDGDLLSELLDKPTETDEEGNNLLFKKLNWQPDDLAELLNHFDLIVDNLSELATFNRIYKAHKLVADTGLSAKQLIEATGNNPNEDTVNRIQSALRAKYDEAGWLKVIQPINDRLRNLQRAALVEHVLVLMAQNTKTVSINTADKLFEYFLIDVEMDACMKTSRIKQALSTVQLFIYRCLMNLEPKVSSTYINAQQWQWMKRYRVWEANRKVFLYPENWLEPELRDNKSPFFKDLESELLQSDITDDAATTALLNYLEKLDDVAKLEICGMYLQENELKKDGVYYGADDILHVIGRTAGASRKYYYRRFEYGYWTAWEKVNLDIEDNPILPVVWNGRLFLFWLNILTKGPENKESGIKRKSEDKNKLTEAELVNDTLNNEISVEINLSWSEYYNGKWQPRRTSDFDNPIAFGPYSEFYRNRIQLNSLIGEDNELYVHAKYKNGKSSYFKLYNKHSIPEQEEPLHTPKSIPRKRTFVESSIKLSIEYGDDLVIDYDLPDYLDRDSATYEELMLWNEIQKQVFFEHQVLGKTFRHALVHPNHFVENIYEKMFFLQNARHIFYVNPSESQTTIPQYGNYGFYQPAAKPELEIVIPEDWNRPIPTLIPEFIPQVEDPILDIGGIGDPRIIDPTPTPYIDAVLKTDLDNTIQVERAIDFKGTKIGAIGSLEELNRRLG